MTERGVNHGEPAFDPTAFLTGAQKDHPALGCTGDVFSSMLAILSTTKEPSSAFIRTISVSAAALPCTVYNLLICTVLLDGAQKVFSFSLSFINNGGLSPNTALCHFGSAPTAASCSAANGLSWHICVYEMALAHELRESHCVKGARDQLNSEDLDKCYRYHCENGLQVLSMRVTTCYNRLGLDGKQTNPLENGNWGGAFANYITGLQDVTPHAQIRYPLVI